MIDKDIVAFLKFGKREDIEKFKQGSIHFGNAKHYRELEKKIKGQGDANEGTLVFSAVNLRFSDEQGNVRVIDKPINCRVGVPVIDNVPIFCLFTVYQKDCAVGNPLKIKLSHEIIDTVKTHFPEADTVAIIRNPSEFDSRIKLWKLGNEFELYTVSDTVKYFNYSGYVTEYKGKKVISNDLRYFQYLISSGANHEETAYKTLFAKDEFFKNEQEYRYVISNMEIHTSGENFRLNISDLIETESMQNFFACIEE